MKPTCSSAGGLMAPWGTCCSPRAALLMTRADGRGTYLQQTDLALLQGFFNFKATWGQSNTGEVCNREKSVTGSKEKKVRSCLEREAVGERHQQSRGRIRENQENGKKELRTSEKKAGEYRSLEVHKNAVKKEKTLGTWERKRNALNN